MDRRGFLGALAGVIALRKWREPTPLPVVSVPSVQLTHPTWPPQEATITTSHSADNGSTTWVVVRNDNWPHHWSYTANG